VETAGYALGMEPCSSPPIAVNASYFDIDVSCGVHFEDRLCKGGRNSSNIGCNSDGETRTHGKAKW
jgi:hypothetical protein